MVVMLDQRDPFADVLGDGRGVRERPQPDPKVATPVTLSAARGRAAAVVVELQDGNEKRRLRGVGEDVPVPRDAVERALAALDECREHGLDQLQPLAAALADAIAGGAAADNQGWQEALFTDLGADGRLEYGDLDMMRTDLAAILVREPSDLPWLHRNAEHLYGETIKRELAKRALGEGRDDEVRQECVRRCLGRRGYLKLRWRASDEGTYRRRHFALTDRQAQSLAEHYYQGARKHDRLYRLRENIITELVNAARERFRYSGR